MLEVCVTSNSCLGTPVRSHPVRMYRDAGFRLSVNPDDRAITTTTVAREYELWREIHGFTDQEFAEINADAVSAAFCDDETKARLSSSCRRRMALHRQAELHDAARVPARRESLHPRR